MRTPEVIAELERHHYECTPRLLGGVFLCYDGEPVGFLSELDIIGVSYNRLPRKVDAPHKYTVLRILRALEDLDANP